MLRQEKQALRVFRRVRDFLATNPPSVGYGSVEKVVVQLKAVVERLEGHAMQQDARARQSRSTTVANQLWSRAIRKEYLVPISRASRTLFPDAPPVLAALHMPKARDYEGVIVAAESMARNAEQHTEKFVGIGLPPDFAERLRAATAALREGINTQAAELAQRSASTAGLRDEYARGRDIVRMLDAMIAPRLAATPTRLAEWLSISRFVRQPGGEDEVDQPGTPTPVEASKAA